MPALKKVALIISIHNHQPVGNIPDVFERAYRQAYLPFIEMVERFPEIKIVLHNSGPLLEWFEDNAPEYIDRVRELVSRGQVEILTGGFYEPILTAIPERDRRGQIEKLTEYTKQTFGMTPRGMWVAERVWEPHLAVSLAASGVEYVPLDDHEFLLAGVPEEELVGYFITEDEGHPLGIFPISKKLRYLIPFAPPEKTVSFMRSLAERGEGLLAVLGDDGEKFGLWSGTHKHVYQDRWLETFLSELRRSSSWLETLTFSEYVDREPARGRVYLPSCSYPEMMEWALPTPARRNYGRLRRQLESEGRLEEWGPLVSGGLWRGFLAKYFESNSMHKKMLRVSDKIRHRAETLQREAALDAAEQRADEARDSPQQRADETRRLREAREELWKGQCNCAYWHGIFGGLYLPHLRSAVYGHLIRAENIADSWRGERWDDIEVADIDRDGLPEVLLESHRSNVYVAPGRGGMIFEIDLKDSCTNILATMSRYEEAYHDLLDSDPQEAASGSGPASIHVRAVAKQTGLGQLALEDPYPKKAAIDHFLRAGITPQEAERAMGAGSGKLTGGACCQFQPRRDAESVGVEMWREGTLAGAGPLRLGKQVRLTQEGRVEVEYTLAAGAPLKVEFASEWNLAFLTADRDLVFLESDGGEARGLGERAALVSSPGLRITDRLVGQVVLLDCSPPAGFWIWPLETASRSEDGLERVFQGATIVPHWTVELKGEQKKTFSIVLRTER